MSSIQPLRNQAFQMDRLQADNGPDAQKSFEQVMQLNDQQERTVPAKTLSNKTTPAISRSQNLVKLGSINSETPTVSHVLKANEKYSSTCWNLIFAQINAQKDYRQMRPGTEVFLQPNTGEILWGKAVHSETIDSTNINTLADGAYTPLDNDYRNNSIEQDHEKVVIGTISDAYPTVSHLLRANRPPTVHYLTIIHDQINQGKPFTRLPPGTQVSLDLKTNELFFDNVSQTDASDKIAAKSVNPAVSMEDNFLYQETFNDRPATQTGGNDISRELSKSVRKFIGTPYSELDCYGLVIQGLVNHGIQYHGSGGLRENLENLARHEGLPANTYINGEGLVAKVGSTVYSTSLDHVSSPNNTAEKVYRDMQNHLQDGFILSFSTDSKGHTGVVSESKGQWTYINSGLIDNHVSPGRISRRVGEEYLKEEIENWCSLASKRQESLKITLGRLDEDKLQRFSMRKPHQQVSEIAPHNTISF